VSTTIVLLFAIIFNKAFEVPFLVINSLINSNKGLLTQFLVWFVFIKLFLLFTIIILSFFTNYKDLKVIVNNMLIFLSILICFRSIFVRFNFYVAFVNRFKSQVKGFVKSSFTV
jgi:hypothetical protein